MSLNLHPECLPESGIHADIARRATERERRRCIKVLEDLRDSSQHSGAEWIAYRFAITALSSSSRTTKETS